MGSSPTVAGGGVLSSGSGSNNSGGGGRSDCDCCCGSFGFGLKCWCRFWRLENWLVSFSSLAFFIGSALLLAAVSTLYAWIFISPFGRPNDELQVGCRPDGEGSWSIGVFYGDSPFSLKPLESVIV